ncbi:MAG: ArsR family transcriptional regulator [Proteobacteria bacterium]|nr:ArsR family transcriptional regulator [Pseudomonadota bacterium]
MSASKQLVFEQFARVARALGSPHRLELLDVLCQGERSVERLALAAGLSVGNASQHLQQLRRASLVTTRKSGTHVVYALADREIISLIRALWRVGERNLAELDRLVQHYYRDRDRLEPVTRDALLKRLRRRSVVVIDVRPYEEYVAGHVPGAISIPVTDLRQRLKEVPRGCEIVACCRGPYCVYAYQAVEILRTAGLPARRLEGGFLEWQADGHPVQRGEPSIAPNG